MYDQGVFDTQAVEDRGNLFSQLPGGNPDNLELSPGGVGQGSQDIKYGTDSKLTAGGSSILHRRVEDGGEHKADTYRLQALGY